jgi:hypothetical protein
MQGILARAVAIILRIGIRPAVTGAALLFGLSEYELSHWLLDIHSPVDLDCFLQAVIVALGAGLALWLILRGLINQRRLMEDELRRVAELNHHLRNALEVIVLAHHSAADREHQAMVLECVNRIDQKLRELFPVCENARLRKKEGKWEISSDPR